MVISKGIPAWSKTSAAADMISRSDALPIAIPTRTALSIKQI
jgi:hypothetical protein